MIGERGASSVALESIASPRADRLEQVAGVVRIVLWAAQAAFIFYVAIIFLPPNPFTMHSETKLAAATSSTLPQGWGFFTKSPREEFFRILNRDAQGRWIDAFRAPEAEPLNWFGWSRFPRAQGTDVGLLLEQLGTRAAGGCTGGLDACLHAKQPLLQVALPSRTATVCGDVALDFAKPVPWSWAHQFTKIHVDHRVLKLRVSCK